MIKYCLKIYKKTLFRLKKIILQNRMNKKHKLSNKIKIIIIFNKNLSFRLIIWINDNKKIKFNNL